MSKQEIRKLEIKFNFAPQNLDEMPSYFREQYEQFLEELQESEGK